MTLPPVPHIPVAVVARANGARTDRAPADSTPNPRAVQPERPSVATPASTVARGYAEVETGVERDTPGDGTHAVSLPTELKLGLGGRRQLNVYLPTSGETGTTFGLGDVAVGLKWRVLDQHPLLADVAILPSVKFNTGGARGTGTTDATLLLIDSRAVGPVSLDLNASQTWRTGDGTRTPRRSTFWSAAAGVPVRGALGWGVETYGYPGTHGPAGHAPIVAVLTGPTFNVRPELALDIGTIVPITGPQPHALYAGLVANLGRFARR